MVLTFFYAQLFGIMMLVVGISLLVHKRMYLSMLTEYAERRSMLFPLSFLSLLIGSTVTLTHNVWQGGLLPVLVSLVGWMILLKGIGYLVLPDYVLKKMVHPLTNKRSFMIVVVLIVLLGLYLFLAGSGGR